MNNKLICLIQNILFSLFLLVVSININACKKENQRINIQEILPISNDYSEVKIEKNKVKEDSKNIIYQLKRPELKNIFLNLDLEKENAVLEINDQKILTDFNFTYDVITEDAISEIKLLINNEGNLVLLFPVATEEYLTFQILKYDKLKNIFSDSSFYFETHDDIHELYMKSKATLSEQGNSYLLKIGAYQFKGNFEPKNFNTVSDSNQNSEIFNGNYNICIENQREDSIKSETCYEIAIKSNTAIVDANTSVCKGNYMIEKISENEITIKNDTDANCFFKIKKEKNNYFIIINDSKKWQELKKE